MVDIAVAFLRVSGQMASHHFDQIYEFTTRALATTAAPQAPMDWE